MTNTPTHSLAVGASPVSRYGELGGFTGTMIAPPTRIKGMIAGFPNCGKSKLLQDCPDNWIFNLDDSSSVSSPMRATLFPGKDIEGFPIGDAGARVVVDYDLFLPKIETLKLLARESKPRPKMVTFDSLSAWIRLLRVWIPRNAKRLGMVSKDDPRASFQWKDIDGRAAWDFLYDHIVNTISDLSAHGYGVWLTVHVVNEKIAVGENVFSVKPELTITSGFWKRMQDIFEFVGAIDVETGTQKVEEEVKSNYKGREMIEKRVRDVPIRRRYLTVAKADLQGIMKIRVPFPDRIELTAKDAWSDFERAYQEAMKKASTTT